MAAKKSSTSVAGFRRDVEKAARKVRTDVRKRVQTATREFQKLAKKYLGSQDLKKFGQQARKVVADATAQVEKGIQQAEKRLHKARVELERGAAKTAKTVKKTAKRKPARRKSPARRKTTA